jgi:ATP-binding cassette subfamily C protein LapB
VELSPGWADAFQSDDSAASMDDLERLTGEIGWPRPRYTQEAPGPAQFPLLVYKAEAGWALAEQWEAVGLVRVIVGGQPEVWSIDEHQLTFFNLDFPVSAAANSPKRAFDVFVDALRSRKRMLVDAAIATVVLNIITLATSLYTMQIYDRVVPRAGYSTLWVLTIGVVIATLFDFILRIVRATMLERESAAIDAEVSEFFFSRAVAVRLDARQGGGVGTMAGQLRSYDQIRVLLSSATVFAIADLPFALFFIWVIYLLSGPVALVPLVSFIISIGLGFAFAWMIRRQADNVQIGTNRKNGLLVEALDAAETIKANRGGWQMLARWNCLVEDVERDDYDMKRLSAVAQSASAMIQQIAYVGIIAWGAIEIINGNMTAGALIACSIISGRVNGPLVIQLPGMIVQATYAKAALKGLDSFLSLPVDREPEVDYLRPEKLQNSVRLEDVSFVYPGARNGVSVKQLQIAPGEKIGVIGPVGSGKSTLLKILAGLFPPQTGAIYLSGLEMGQIAEDRLRRHVGYLGQEFRLVNGTLKEQLTLGISDPGDDALIAAAEATGLGKLIASHPMGLDLAISEGGRGLSGGQRALAGLTRLLLARPKLWLLDEPTAALDQDSEAQALRAVLSNLAKDDTLVLVTHKLQLLSLVQRVVVVINGQVILDGPTADVLKKLTPAAPQNEKVTA